MRSSILILVILLTLSGLTQTVGTARPVGSTRTVHSTPAPPSDENTFDLTAFGAVGDGVTDDGPALQSALNSIAQAGGGILFVPAGRYAIITPVLKDFSGSGASLTIVGVPSSTPVNTQGNGQELTHGLDLTSEFVIRTGAAATALSLRGLENLLVAEMVFIGTQEALTDAKVTLGIYAVTNATIRHSEFYGLSSLVAGGAIVHADSSRLSIDRTVFLGCTANSGVRGPVVLNTTWKDLSVTESIFADYGQRPNYFGKLGFAAPFSWIMVGNSSATSNLSPRREVTIRNVFLDEGGFLGVSVIPDYYDPQSAASDLVYISDLRMNVSNLNASGVYINRAKRVLIERSRFGWSHLAAAAVDLLNVGEATLDRLECLLAANRIMANAGTGRLRVINSIYTHLDSQAQITEVIETVTEAEDHVQYVRQQYLGVLGHEPDAAGHDYWSNLLFGCGTNATCLAAKRLDLSAYLGTGPAPVFSITGRILKENGVALPGVALSVNGSPAIATQTDAQGNYRFEGLPTSGVYALTPTRVHYTFNSPTWTATTPSGDRVANFTAILNNYVISGRVLKSTGQPLGGVTVTHSGSQSGSTTTDATGNYSLNLPAEGDYTLTLTKQNYDFSPPTRQFNDLEANKVSNFTGALRSYSIAGRVLNSTGQSMSGTTVTLSGSQAATATTDANGNYSFVATAEGSYTVTVIKVHHTFVPPSVSFNNLSQGQTANFTGTLNRYPITGRVTTAGGVALAGVTISLSGAESGSAITGPNGTFSFSVLAGSTYIVVPAKTEYLFTPASATFVDVDGSRIADFAARQISRLGFSAATYQIVESETSLVLTVVRTGDSSDPATATYSTSDDSGLDNCSAPGTEEASSGCDYTTSIGNVHFAPGETSKTIFVPIIDDAYAEGSERFEVSLSNLAGVEMGSHGTATVTITDNENVDGTNPIAGAGWFVRQHYVDFLRREPDPAGLAFWRDQITSCGGDAACVELRRINVSAAFFLSIEFRETGYLVYRIYKASYGDLPNAPVPLTFEEFLPDAQEIGQGLIIGEGGSDEVLENNKNAFAAAFVARSRFAGAHPTTLTPAEFVSALFSNAGVTPSAAELTAAISQFGTAATSQDMSARGRALRMVAENQTFAQQELNKAFVLMQYFGYLRRNPNDPPEATLDFQGYNFWLAKLNQFNGNFINAEMVKAFILSGEYRQRFGP
ncbi:MAG: carboxypeptidase regulatory-like domain-containing protein [Pyrinomonadaceae bacterium]|nr:carboxypeptidase regulatory-like domain-containing protein [Pyrinomonadaceae bacterium]